MPRRFDHLADVETFATVVDKGSMTAAAVALGTTPSVLSRALTRLEARLGVQLLRRTTRRLGLTEAGRQYVEQARSAFALFDDAERQLQGSSGDVRGSVRLSVPTTYGHYRLPALLQSFHAAHPQVRVELGITNRNVDLVAEGYDLAIRLGPLPDSGLVARRLEDAPLCLLASPAYVAQHGAPQDIAALARHHCLPFVLPSTGRVIPWLLCETVEGEPRDVEWVPAGGIQVTDDVLGVVSLMLAGAGICQTYDFIARDWLAQGRAVEVLPQARGRVRPFSLVYAPHRSHPAAMRALIAALLRSAAVTADTPQATGSATVKL